MSVLDSSTNPEQEPESSETLREFSELLSVIDALREHCPWTSAQTHQDLAPYAAEEAEEIAEAIAQLGQESHSGAHLADELGDLLLQVLLHSAVGRDAENADERFELIDVLRALKSKLVRRSPHVFASDGSVEPRIMSVEEIDRQWDEIKAAERSGQ